MLSKEEYVAFGAYTTWRAKSAYESDVIEFTFYVYELRGDI